MLIIVEGPDCVGKTTLVEDLRAHLHKHRSTRLRPIVMHKGPIKSHPLVEYELPLDAYRADSALQPDVLCDRWHIGEDVYGPLLRGTSKLDTASWLHIDMFLASRGALLITLLERSDRLIRRMKARGDDLISVGDVPMIVRGYRALAGFTTPVTTVTLHGGEKLSVPDIVQLAYDLQFGAAKIGRFRTYIGAPDPQWVLFGDTRGRPNEPHSAAFAPYGNTSGAYLMRAIATWAWRARFGIANACEENLEALMHEVGNPPAVALGKNAHHALERAGIPHGSMPHPQYVRRFHHKRSEDYGYRILRNVNAQEDWSKWPH